MKVNRFEENESKLKRIEERLADLHQADERKATEIREEVNKLKSVVEAARMTRERIFESDFGEFGILEKRLRTLLDQSAKVKSGVSKGNRKASFENDRRQV